VPCSHDRERGHHHPAVPDRHQLGDPRFGLLLQQANRVGPVRWRVEHRVAHLRPSRLRTGATGWDLYQDGQNPRLFIELFGIPSWEEHLRQHPERQTGTDLEYHDAAALSDPPPQTGHYLAADIRQ